MVPSEEDGQTFSVNFASGEVSHSHYSLILLYARDQAYIKLDE